MNCKKWIATALGLLAGGGAAWASGFQTSEFSAAHVGQATAGVTLTENAAVVAINPAAMVRLEEGWHFLGGFAYFDAEADWATLNPDGTVDDSGTTVGTIPTSPHGYGVWNLGEYAVGVGLFFPFNAIAEYPADWPGKAVTIKQELNVGYNAFTGAWAVSEGISLGLAINLIGARAELTRSLIVTPGVEIPLTLGATGDEIGFNISFLYEGDNWAIGVTHAPEYDLELNGAVRFDTSQAPGLTSTFPDGTASTTLGMPSVTEIGVSWKASRRNPLYFIELAVTHTGWSNFTELRIKFDTGRPSAEDVSPRNWDDTIGIKLGGNWVLSREGDTDHLIRGGIFIDESPVPAETLEPGVPDSEGRNEIAVGYGYKSGGFLLDVSYFIVDPKESQTTLDGSNEFAARYDAFVQILAVSAGYRF